MNSLIGIFTSPKEVFEKQKEDSNWWLPLIVILVFAILANSVATSSLDQEVLTEAQFQAMAESGLPQEQIDAARKVYSDMEGPPGSNQMMLMTQAGAVLGVVLLTLFAVLFHAIYFKICSAITKLDMSFGDCLALVNWGRMPWVVLSIVTVLAALLMAGTADPNDFKVTSLAYYMDLPNKVPSGLVPTMSQIVWTLDIFVIWSIALYTIGFQVWSGKSIGVSATIAALPYVVIYAIVMSL